MNLYLISQDHNKNWDTYDSAVVAAESEDDARKMIPGSDSFQSEDTADWLWTWTAPEHVKVTFIGIYALDNGPCTVCCSFNSG